MARRALQTRAPEPAPEAVPEAAPEAAPGAAPKPGAPASPPAIRVAALAPAAAPALPNVTAGMLDAAYCESVYLHAFPDVATAIKAGRFASGLEHFLHAGRAEMQAGTRPVPPHFAVAERAREVRQAALAFGAEQICRLYFGVSPAEFDAALYTALFPDVADAVADASVPGAFAHWLETGYREITSGQRRLTFRHPDAGPIGGSGPARHARSRHYDKLLARPFGISLFAPLAMQSGLGTVARGMLGAIQAAGIDVDVWAYDTTFGCQIMPRDQHRQPRLRVNLLLANAEILGRLRDAYPPATFDDSYNIAVWQWELASLPPGFMPAFAGIDEVWTSSRFEVNAIAALAPVPVRLVPPPVRVPPNHGDAHWSAATLSQADIPDDAFVFITMLDLASRVTRKNPLAVIRAFAELAPEVPRSLLLVKCHGDEPAPDGDAELLAAVAATPRVLLLRENLSQPQLAALRARADCLVSAHRSEGFGLNIAEFLACAKPVIATGYSGNIDFFDAEVGYPIDYDLVELPATIEPYQAGYIWAEPRHISLVAQMRHVLLDMSDRAARAQAGAGRMADRYDVARIGATIATRLDELELAAKQPRFMAAMSRAVPPPQHAPPGPFGPPPGLSVLCRLAARQAPDQAQAILHAMAAQTDPSWELVLRPDADCTSAMLAWLEATRGASARVRVLSADGPALLEASTARFVVFAEDAADLPPDALAAIAAVLADEPACDMVVRAGPHGGAITAVRRALLLANGEPDLPPAAAPADVQARILRQTRMVRWLQ